ncbi:MAG: MFS transporter [Pseudomonadales bacterium]
MVVAKIAYSFHLQSAAVVAPGLMEDLALNTATLGTLIGLFTLPGLVLAVPSSYISSRYGERLFIVACLVLMVIGGLLSSIATNSHYLWLGRLIAGVGAVGVNTVTLKIVADWFVGKEMATAMALNVAGFPVGIALSLVTLGHFATADSWQIAFLASAGVSLIALIIFLTTYRPAEVQETGAARAPKLSPGEFGMVSLSGLMWALQNAMVILMVSFVPLFLVSEGLEAGIAASVVGVALWVTILSVPLGGIIVDRFRRPNTIIVFGMLVGRLGLLLVLVWSQSIPVLLLLMVALTFVGTLPSGPILALAPQVLRPETRAVGVGIVSTWLYAGLALGPVMGGFASDLTGDPAAPIYLIGALAIALVVILGLFRSLQARGVPEVIAIEKT